MAVTAHNFGLLQKIRKVTEGRKAWRSLSVLWVLCFSSFYQSKVRRVNTRWQIWGQMEKGW